MKKLLKITFISLAVLLMQGCATHQNFVNKYNSWVGQDINRLIQKIGYPDSTYILPNKNKVYVYERSRVYSYPSMAMGYGYGRYYSNYYGMFGYGNDVVHETCKLYLETDKKGIIVKWGSRGNHCVSN
ncbi:MAG: hypothetical protein OQK45_01655 [Sulfurovum sp.]|nr:hypothetical protein [Sulfurovum sp.]